MEIITFLLGASLVLCYFYRDERNYYRSRLQEEQRKVAILESALWAESEQSEYIASEQDLGFDDE